MATQKDLDVLKQKLRDLDAKLKSMGGGSTKRDPRFDLAMANQNYKNSMAEQRARMEADRANSRIAPIPPPAQGQYTQGRLMGAPTDAPLLFGRPRPVAPISASNGLTPAQIAENIQNSLSPNMPQGQYTQGRLMGAPTEQPNPNAGKPLYFQALEGELQKQFLDKNPQLKPKPGTALTPQLIQQNYAKFLQNQMAEVNKFNAANPQYAQDIRKPNPVLARQSEQSFLESLLDYSKVSPDQVNVLNQLKSGYLNQGQGGGTQPSIPQNPQMATYNNLLQQGIQRGNTMNQDAASNFANMQAGAPTMQPAVPAKANPTMPIAGLGMQQPKATPAPRKFSTVSNQPARFG